MQLQDVLFTQGFGTRRVCAGLIQQGLVQFREAGREHFQPVRGLRADHDVDPQGLWFQVQGVAWPYAERAYLDYAVSVVKGRALPDVADGQKPVQRRIIFAMHQMGLAANAKPVKSARVVGDVLGKFHPHGDQSVYDALVRLAQDFAMRYPLIDGQGNFGSIDGDSPAAMRYTEVRMNKLTSELLADLEKDTVDWAPNYDEKELEPTVLPTRVPNLLLNGAVGIAVGMATNIPPHNLRELISACLALIDDPNLGVRELLQYVHGPDFPTAGFIIGHAGIRQAYMTGRGSLTIRAKCEIEEDEKGREAIVVTEIPYQINKARLIERIAELVNEKKIEGISDIRDESDKSGMRIVIELKRDAVGDVVLNQLYRFTALQSSFGANFVALNGGKPQVMTLKDMITTFVDFREVVIGRRTKYQLSKARERAHISLNTEQRVTL